MCWIDRYFYICSQSLFNDSFWSAATALSTVFLGIVALLGERFWYHIRRPIIEVSFDKQSERCFRWAILAKDSLMDQGVFLNVKRQYFRIRVLNNGSTPIKNLQAKVELFDTEKNILADHFEPTALNWIPGFQVINLAPGEDNYLDLISQVLEPISEADYFINFSGGSTLKKRAEIQYKLRLEIADRTPRGIAWDRYLQTWKLRVSFHADNLPKPAIKFFEFIPSSKPNVSGDLREDSPWRE